MLTKTFLFIAVVLLYCTACQKQEIATIELSATVPILDYRDSFIVGNYNGIMEESYWRGFLNPLLPDIANWDTSYSASITIIKDSVPDRIIVQYGGTQSMSLRKYNTSTANYYKFNHGFGTGGPYYCFTNYDLEIFLDNDSVYYELTTGQSVYGGAERESRTTAFSGHKQ